MSPASHDWKRSFCHKLLSFLSALSTRLGAELVACLIGVRNGLS